MPKGPFLVWFRDDLRLSDHPALVAALASDCPVVPVYVYDEHSPAFRPMGGASRWWLHHSLAALDLSLRAKGSYLRIVRGAAQTAIAQLVDHYQASGMVWSRRYGAAEIAVDASIKAWCKDHGISCESFNGSLLVEPWQVTTQAGQPMKVFTPFWKSARANHSFTQPLPAPVILPVVTATASPLEIPLDDLTLLPTKPDWAKGFTEHWQAGEAGAQQRLLDFLDDGLKGYGEDRNRPDRNNVSRLAPYLRFGNISPRQVWHVAVNRMQAGECTASERDLTVFQSELGWREFSYHLLFHNPDLVRKNYQARFDKFPWRNDPAALKAWQNGMTGYPIVDAGMRQLWQTGWMHNRVRMVVASFLIKHLMIDWRDGEAWFWDTLLDADPASNAASWQWVAGSGADAAPYFRIFNPVLQGERFDPKGDYVRHFVPELARLPKEFIHKPWTASEWVLREAGITLGTDYPAPLIDHKTGRDRALAAFSSINA
ncbi:MAG: deoxyribodipyrimidine photo-lyase [Rhizobiales bacterium]|nr:deoxyribodipyrimidine photo-lyase [Hyphomicrobiales bacterium]